MAACLRSDRDAERVPRFFAGLDRRRLTSVSRVGFCQYLAQRRICARGKTAYRGALYRSARECSARGEAKPEQPAAAWSAAFCSGATAAAHKAAVQAIGTK